MAYVQMHIVSYQTLHLVWDGQLVTGYIWLSIVYYCQIIELQFMLGKASKCFSPW